MKGEVKELRASVDRIISREQKTIQEVTQTKLETGVYGSIAAVIDGDVYQPIIDASQKKIDFLKTNADSALQAVEIALGATPPNMEQAQNNMNIAKGYIAIANKAENKA